MGPLLAEFIEQQISALPYALSVCYDHVRDKGMKLDWNRHSLILVDKDLIIKRPHDCQDKKRETKVNATDLVSDGIYSLVA